MAIDIYLQVNGIKGESSDTTQQKTSGGSGGNTASGWDLARNCYA